MAKEGATLLFNAYLNHERYTDNVSEIKFKTPVVIKGIILLEGRHPPPAPHQQLIRCWALDLSAGNAARFGPLYCEKSLTCIPGHKAQVRLNDSFPTNHLVIRGKFSSIHLALYGQSFSDTISKARAQGIHAKPLILPLPKEAAGSEATAAAAAAAAPVNLLQLPGLPRQHMPLATLPARFAEALLTAARYWRLVRLSHGSIARNPPHDRFDALFKAAEAVMAAQAGDAAALQELLVVREGAAPGALKGWAAAEEEVIDMATSWPELLASVRTTSSASLKVGSAGVAAALLLCCVPSLAVKFMAFHGPLAEPMSGVRALWAALKAPQLPPKAARLLLATLEQLTASTGSLGCACLLGVCAPEVVKQEVAAAGGTWPAGREDDADVLATLDDEEEELDERVRQEQEEARMLATLGEDDDKQADQQQQQQAVAVKPEVKDEPMLDAEGGGASHSRGGSRSGTQSGSSREQQQHSDRSVSHSPSRSYSSQRSREYGESGEEAAHSADDQQQSRSSGSRSPGAGHSGQQEDEEHHSYGSQGDHEQQPEGSGHSPQRHSRSRSRTPDSQEQRQHSGGSQSDQHPEASRSRSPGNSGSPPGSAAHTSSRSRSPSGSRSPGNSASRSPSRSRSPSQQQGGSGSKGHSSGGGSQQRGGSAGVAERGYAYQEEEELALDYEASEGDMDPPEEQQADSQDPGSNSHRSHHSGSEQRAGEECRRSRGSSGHGSDPEPSEQPPHKRRRQDEQGRSEQAHSSPSGGRQQTDSRGRAGSQQPDGRRSGSPGCRPQQQERDERGRDRVKHDERSTSRPRDRSRLRGGRRSSRSRSRSPWRRPRLSDTSQGRDRDRGQHDSYRQYNGVKQEVKEEAGDREAAAARRQQLQEAAARDKRLRGGRQMMGALQQLAAQDLLPEATNSCAAVLRRLKAFHVTQHLQDVVGPLLDGSAQPLLLKPPELVAAINTATCALGELALLLVRQPVPPRAVVQDANAEDHPQRQQQQQRQQKWASPAEAAAAVAEAQVGPVWVGPLPLDASVLQQLLSGRVLELVKAAITIVSIHCSKQQAAVAAAADAPPGQPVGEVGAGEGAHHTEAAEAAQRMLDNLLVLHRGLLSSLRHLLGVVLSSSLGWGFCAAAGADLQGLAAAISPGATPQLLLAAGGEPPAPGGANREAVLRAAQQQGGRLAEQLASSLHCHLLVSQAVAQLAQPIPAGGGSCSGALHTLLAAVGSESLRPGALYMLASCPAALRCLLMQLAQLGRLLKTLGRGNDEDAAPELEDLELERVVEEELGLDGGAARAPGPDCLLAAKLLLEVVGEPHPDVALQVLPVMSEVGGRWQEEVSLFGLKRLGSYVEGHALHLQLLSGMAEVGRLVADCASSPQPRRSSSTRSSSSAGRRVLSAPQHVVELLAQQLLKSLHELLPPLLTVDQSALASDTGDDPLPPEMQKLWLPESDDAPWMKKLPGGAGAALMKDRHALGRVLLQLQLLALLLRHPAQVVASVQGRSGVEASGSNQGAASAAADPSTLCDLTAVAMVKVLTSGGLKVLDRALRVAVAAWEACQTDLTWLVQAGDVIDLAALARLQAQAARLLLAAGRAVAAVVRALDGRPLPGSHSVLGALVMAHAAVATSAPGLLGCMGESILAPAAAAASAAGGASGSVYGDLLAARHAMVVALATWQQNKWTPCAVPAVLSVYPGRRGALVQWAEEQAKEAAAASRQPGGAAAAAGGSGKGILAKVAGVQLPPRGGPKELLSALLALGDICPEEWPPAGASQRVARAADAAAAPGGGGPSSAAEAGDAAGYPSPSCIVLRANIAASLEQQMAPLKRVVEFAISSDNKLVRAALVRLCVKASGTGGGMAPFLAPPLLEELQVVMRAPAAAVAAAAGSGGSAAAAARGVALVDGRRVLEVLLLLAGKPALKAALIENKATSLLARYIHKLSSKVREDPGVVEVMGLALEVLLKLCNPDISLTPQQPRPQRLQEDTPPLHETTTLVAALLTILPSLGGCADQTRTLIFGPAPATPQGAKGRPARPAGLPPGLQHSLSGRAALRQGMVKWHALATQTPLPASALRDEGTLKAAVAWGCARLTDTAARILGAAGGQPAGGGVSKHMDAAAKLCKDMAPLLQRVADHADPLYEPAPPTPSLHRFAEAVSASLARAPNKQQQKQGDASSSLQQLAALPPATLACDANMQEFLRAASKRPPRPRRLERWPATSLAEGAAISATWPQPLLPRKRPHALARGSAAMPMVREDDGEPAAGGGRERRGTSPGVTTAEAVASLAPEEGPAVPVVLAPRRVNHLRKGGSARPASRHVDDFEASHGQHQGGPPHMGGVMGGGPMGGPMGGGMMAPGMGVMRPPGLPMGMMRPGGPGMMGAMGGMMPHGMMHRGMAPGMGMVGGPMGMMPGGLPGPPSGAMPGGMQLPGPPQDMRGAMGDRQQQQPLMTNKQRKKMEREQRRLQMQAQRQQQEQQQQQQQQQEQQQHQQQQQPVKQEEGQQEEGHESADELAALNSPSYSDPGDDEDDGGVEGDYKVTEFE